jgi:O-antigen ligase
MRPRQLTALLTFGAAVVVALCVGISIATENYALLVMASTVIIVGTLVVMPGYIPLFVFGLLMPFSLPVPFVYAFPFLFLALGICGVKYWLQRGLQNRKLSRQSTPVLSSTNLSIGLFFTWVFLRYCMKPALPNMMGWGMNVTGFRAWLSYAMCFGVVFFLSRFVGDRAGVLKLMRWLAYVSIFFILIFIPVMLTKSEALGNLFYQLGMFVDRFDNGTLRFVVLPQYGLILFSLALLPNLIPSKRFTRLACIMIALVAVISGGNRSSFGAALIIALAIPLLRRNFVQVAITSGAVAIVAIGGYLAGPMLSQLPHIGLLRPLALVSPDLTEATGGDRNLEWREVRWQRGLEEIRKHPFIGVGYGGLENALSSDVFSEEESEDMSLATGGVHNGYIAGALALGIPAALLFVFILVRQILLNGYRTYTLQKRDPVVADAHCFVCVFLIATAAGIFLASDLNDPIIWFHFALGLFLARLRPQEVRKVAPVPQFGHPALASQPA